MREMLKKISDFMEPVKCALKKVSKVMKTIFGYGILASLAVGCLMFLGYIVALIIGGDTAAKICYFLYKQLAPVLIYATTVIVLFGLVAMYFGGETALSTKGKSKGNKTEEKAETPVQAESIQAESSDDSADTDSSDTK